MFEVTNEFLEQAGFTLPQGEQAEAVRGQVVQMVQRKIGEQAALRIHEGWLDELSELLDGNRSRIRQIVHMAKEGHPEPDADFIELQRLGKKYGATDEEIIQEYAVLAWMELRGIDSKDVVLQAMNETIQELRMIHAKAQDAADR